MNNCTLKDHDVLLSNGTCSYCGKLVSWIDKEDNNFVFYPIVGLRVHRRQKVLFVKCPGCKHFIEI